MTASLDVEFLILGAGWTAGFLIPVLESAGVTYAATSTTGRDGTIAFKFDPDSDDERPFEALPLAKTVLISFPLKGDGQSRKLVTLYNNTHPNTHGALHFSRWIQLGSTGIYQGQSWQDHRSPYDKTNDRAIAEDELLAFGDCESTVFNLAGLYDNQIRRPRNWVSRVAKSRQDVCSKKSLHLIHGKDIARAVLEAHRGFSRVQGQRWILTDLFVYDWWALFIQWGGQLTSTGEDVREIVGSCMNEAKVRALPRAPSDLGRALSSLEFWNAIGIMPHEGRVD